MTFAQGDAFISGSLLSFQQANRIMQNFRGATVPSNLQAGALFSDSDDDLLYHQGASALIEVYTEKSGTLFGNQISNSGFGVWSWSGLAQKTTGEQSDYEIGSAIYDEDGESADDSGNWTKTDCTMARTNDAGNGAGGSNYYYTITEAAATQRISQALSGLTIGKIYKLSVFIKNGTGTWASAVLQIMDNALANTIATINLATEAAWADYSVIFEATETNNQMVLDLALGGGLTAKVDDIKVIEVGPGCVAADDKGPDSWTKTSTLDLLRIQANATYCKGLYGVKAKKGAAGAEYLNAFGRVYDNIDHYMQYRGKTVTFGCWVYSLTAADNVKVQINDSGGTTESSFVAADTLTWVEVTRTCGATITSFTPRILFDGDSADVAYISQPMLIYGSSIGEGNYQPISQELLILEKGITSHKLNSLSGQSSSGWTALKLEADSTARLPKNSMEIRIWTGANDSLSAANNVYLILRANSDSGGSYTHPVSGITNDMIFYLQGDQLLDADGDFEYEIVASGAGNFDLTFFYFQAVKLK